MLLRSGLPKLIKRPSFRIIVSAVWQAVSDEKNKSSSDTKVKMVLNILFLLRVLRNSSNPSLKKRRAYLNFSLFYLLFCQRSKYHDNSDNKSLSCQERE
jgi:hypothetical protein